MRNGKIASLGNLRLTRTLVFIPVTHSVTAASQTPSSLPNVSRALQLFHVLHPGWRFELITSDRAEQHHKSPSNARLRESTGRKLSYAGTTAHHKLERSFSMNESRRVSFLFESAVTDSV